MIENRLLIEYSLFWNADKPGYRSKSILTLVTLMQFAVLGVPRYFSANQIVYITCANFDW